MRIVSIKTQTNSHIAVELDAGFAKLDFENIPPVHSFPDSTIELIRDWDSLKPRVALSDTDSLIAKSEVQLRAPIANPGKIICIGKNYAKHAQEMGSDPPSIPVVFSKFNSAIAAPGAEIVLPKISQKVDFEAELVVVIGKAGRFIDRADAMSHVFGYCCGNDISARDWQKEKPGGQWLLGKTFDSFAPLGPCIVTADSIPDPHQLEISLRLNGETMQHSNTSHLIFPIDFLIAHLSQFVTLEPGDLIFTGTPSGVGAGRNPAMFLKPGDRLEVEIEGIGTLSNQVVDC
ncbi:fumarylacetoacetate hydrolase family protein [Mariniblastus fucicola]|nr:fumarylacetoacetate hydrolase family protein [Mariniblastus fucicola]